MSHCKFFGSNGFRSYGNSPHKKHQHDTEDEFCMFCGSPGYGYCGNSPSRMHEH